MVLEGLASGTALAMGKVNIVAVVLELADVACLCVDSSSIVSRLAVVLEWQHVAASPFRHFDTAPRLLRVSAAVLIVSGLVLKRRGLLLRLPIAHGCSGVGPVFPARLQTCCSSKHRCSLFSAIWVGERIWPGLDGVAPGLSLACQLVHLLVF